MQIGTDWATLKAFTVSRGLSLQYIQTPDTYYLWAADGPSELTSQITIVTPVPANSDQLDFETNFKPSANASPRANVVQVLGKDELTLCPFGALSPSLSPGAATIWDVVMPATMVLRGAELFAPNATLGDWISLQIIDTANIVGANGTPSNPTVLGQYVQSWYVMPGIGNKLEDVSISQSLAQGLTVRIIYNSVAPTTAPATQAIINFISYTGV